VLQRQFFNETTCLMCTAAGWLLDQ